MKLITVQARGTKGALEFIRRALPRTYAHLERELRSTGQLRGLGRVGLIATATETPPSKSLVDTIKEIATVAGQVYLTREQMQAQRQILNVQLQRAQQGLAPLPIDPSTYGLPQPSVGVSLDEGTKKILLYGGIGLGLALMLGLIGGGRAARS